MSTLMLSAETRRRTVHQQTTHSSLPGLQEEGVNKPPCYYTCFPGF